MKNQKKNSGIWLLCISLFLGAVIALLGERQPLIYAEKNEMNYETTQEKKQEENKAVVMEQETTFTTEEQISSEKPTDVAQSTQTNSKETQDKKPGGKKKKGDKGKKNIPDENSNNTKVESRKLASLTVSWPGCDELLYGIKLDRSAIRVVANYDNGDQETAPIEDCSIEGFNELRLGEANCVISYYGVSENVSYTILNYEIGITCVAWDRQQSYRYGDAFSKSDLSLVANMADGSEEIIATKNFDVVGIDTKQIGEYSCRILYKDFAIKENYIVHNYPVALNSSLKRFTFRGEYTWGDVASRCKVTATMADGTEQVIDGSAYTISGFQNDEAGKFTMTIYYEDVQTSINYRVYSDKICVVQDFDGIGMNKEITFSKEITIRNEKDLAIPEEQKVNDKKYKLVGIYTDSKHKKEWEGPETFYAKREIQFDTETLDWNYHYLYAKYKLVEEPEKQPETPTNPEETPQPQGAAKWKNAFPWWK